MSKAPAFQFYARDFLTDERVLMMPLEAQGAYVRLLCHQWLEGSIPGDLRRLARLCQVDEGTMSAIWDEVGPCFDSEGDRLFNARLREQRQEREEWVEKCRRGGKASGESRRAKGSSTTPEQPLQVNGNTAPTTASASAQPTEDETHIGQRLNDEWRRHNLGVPVRYDWLQGGVEVTSLTADFSDEQILSAPAKIATTDGLAFARKLGPAWLARRTGSGRLGLEVALNWRDDEKATDSPTGDWDFS